MTPEELAADFEQIAAWMATRPNGVTWTGDGLDGTVAGLRDAAKSVRKHLIPAWDAMTAELATVGELRKVIEEILDWFWEPTEDDDGSEATFSKVDEWRARAGLDGGQ